MMDWDVWMADEDFRAWERELNDNGRSLNAVQGIALACGLGVVLWGVIIYVVTRGA